MKSWNHIPNGSFPNVVADHRKREIADLVGILLQQVNTMKCTDWGDVGTLSHIVETLEELTDEEANVE